MNNPEPTIRVNVDVTNPGQFFACCGLLELADRLWGGATGWYNDGQFCIDCNGTLPKLMECTIGASLSQLDPDDNTSSPIRISKPFDLRLDWWLDSKSGGREMKVWAGTMESVRIAKAMQNAMRKTEFQTPDLFNEGVIAFDPDNPAKKVEPYYFDARRGANAHSRDVGFSPNDLQLTTLAYPAVEFFCLVGLQRGLPAQTDRQRIYDYHTWTHPLPPELIPAAVSGVIRLSGSQCYRFENWYRTGQKKHKAFIPAILLTRGEQ